MKHTEYYKSGKHVENAKKAALLGAEAGKLKRLKRIEEYNKNPKLCKHCNSPIDYDKKRNLYCSSSCSATVTNLTREPRSVESRKKTSVANTGKKYPNRKPTNNFTTIYLIRCRICGKEQYVNWRKMGRKTCGSDDCVIQACVGERKYQNGSRKPV